MYQRRCAGWHEDQPSSPSRRGQDLVTQGYTVQLPWQCKARNLPASARNAVSVGIISLSLLYSLHADNCESSVVVLLQRGGAVCLKNKAVLDATECRFLTNSAEVQRHFCFSMSCLHVIAAGLGQADGGAVYANEESIASCKECSFEGNSAAKVFYAGTTFVCKQRD